MSARGCNTIGQVGRETPEWQHNCQDRRNRVRNGSARDIAKARLTPTADMDTLFLVNAQMKKKLADIH